VGISYIDNEPIGRIRALPLYQEQFMLLVSSGSRLARRNQITWSEASKLPLCLLTPETQTRRIIDRVLSKNGAGDEPTLEPNAMITLFMHVRTGHWVGIVPSRLTDAYESQRHLKMIPLVSPSIRNTIGLLVRGQQPQAPLISAFVANARRVVSADARSPDHKRHEHEVDAH